MKKLFFILTITILHHFCSAQPYAGFGLRYSMGVFTNNYPSFEKFLKSYDEYGGTSVAHPTEPFNYGMARDFDLTLMFVGLEIGFNFMKMTASTKTEFTSGDARGFDFTRDLVGLEVGYVYTETSRPVMVGLYVGAGMGNTTIDTYFIYPGDIISYGNDKFFNGTYTAFNASPYIGLKYGIGMPNLNTGIKPLNFLLRRTRLTLNIDYMFEFFKNVWLEDKNYGRMFSLDPENAENLPTQVAPYIQDQYSYILNGNIEEDLVVNAMSGWKFQLGLTFYFINDDTD